jgi:hypothetical protein
MLKREITSHLLVAVIWLVIITLLRWSWQWNLVFFWVGGLLGTFLLDADHLFYLLWINPHELTSLRAKRLVEQKRFKEALILVWDTRHERIRLPFRNALFQPILYVLCFFILTSTGSLFGAGLVMGMALHLLKDEVEDLLTDKERLKKWLFWQIKGEVSDENQKIFVILMVLVFLGLNLLLI